MLTLRNESDALKFGKFENITKGDGYFVYSRTYGDEKIIVVCNFDEPREIAGLPDGEYLFGNGGAARKTNGKYSPFETAVFGI